MRSIVATLLLCCSAAQASKLYMGCWADSPELPAFDDNYLYELSGDENYRDCADWCRSNDYEYAAIARGDECRCGNGNDWTCYGKRPDKKCDDDCPDGSPRCGGYFRNAVYSTELWYVGCVKHDPNDRIFSTLLYDDDDSIIPLQCVTACTDAGYYWAGLTDGYKCWCGDEDDIEKATLPENDATDDECNHPCPYYFYVYYNTPICGGYNIMSIYHTLEFK